MKSYPLDSLLIGMLQNTAYVTFNEVEKLIRLFAI